MVVYGGSYGGYTVLIALERWPDVPRRSRSRRRRQPGDLPADDQRHDPEVFKLEFGELEKDAAFLKTISPIEEIDRDLGPAVRLRRRQRPASRERAGPGRSRAARSWHSRVEYIVADNEGH